MSCMHCPSAWAKVIYLWYLAVACDQAGGCGTVYAFGVTGKMWEQSSAPPEDNGQLFVAAVVPVARSSVRADGGKLHLWQSTLWLKGSSVHCIQGLQGKLVVWKGGEGDPDPAQHTKQPQTYTGQKPLPTCHLQQTQATKSSKYKLITIFDFLICLMWVRRDSSVPRIKPCRVQVLKTRKRKQQPQNKTVTGAVYSPCH